MHVMINYNFTQKACPLRPTKECSIAPLTIWSLDEAFWVQLINVHNFTQLLLSHQGHKVMPILVLPNIALPLKPAKVWTSQPW